MITILSLMGEKHLGRHLKHCLYSMNTSLYSEQSSQQQLAPCPCCNCCTESLLS